MIPDFDTFHSWLGKSFETKESHVVFTLKSCKKGSQSGKYCSFSLDFFCESAEPMPQGMFTLIHKKQSFDLFMVPVESVPSGFIYQAIINKAKP